MSYLPKKYQRGVVDPISLIALGFLVVSLFVGTVVISKKGFNFDIRERAKELDKLEKITPKTTPTPTPKSPLPKIEPKEPQTPPSPFPVAISTPTPTLSPTSTPIPIKTDISLKEEAPKPFITPTPIPTPTSTPYCTRLNSERCIHGCEPTLTGGKCILTPSPTPTPRLSPTPTPTSCLGKNITLCRATSGCRWTGTICVTNVPTPTIPPYSSEGTITRVTEMLRNIGQTCSNNYECESGNCQVAPGGKSCVPAGTVISPPRGEGESCGTTAYDRVCDSGLVCRTNTCQRPPASSLLANGEVCTQNSQCSSGYCSNFTTSPLGTFPQAGGQRRCQPTVAETTQMLQESAEARLEAQAIAATIYAAPIVAPAASAGSFELYSTLTNLASRYPTIATFVRGALTISEGVGIIQGFRACQENLSSDLCAGLVVSAQLGLLDDFAREAEGVAGSLTRTIDDAASLFRLPDVDNPAGWTLGTYGNQTLLASMPTDLTPGEQLLYLSQETLSQGILSSSTRYYGGNYRYAPLSARTGYQPMPIEEFIENIPTPEFFDDVRDVLIRNAEDPQQLYDELTQIIESSPYAQVQVRTESIDPLNRGYLSYNAPRLIIIPDAPTTIREVTFPENTWLMGLDPNNLPTEYAIMVQAEGTTPIQRAGTAVHEYGHIVEGALQTTLTTVEQSPFLPTTEAMSSAFKVRFAQLLVESGFSINTALDITMDQVELFNMVMLGVPSP